jgi:hypothetical protein
MRTNLSNELCTQSFSNLSPRARYDEAGSHTLILDSSKRILDPLSEPSALVAEGSNTYLPSMNSSSKSSNPLPVACTFNSFPV